MSGFSQRWSTRDGKWYASAWYGASPEEGGPFDTEDEAVAFIEAARERGAAETQDVDA